MQGLPGAVPAPAAAPAVTTAKESEEEMVC